jgi:riboflavin kinase/FMN adenylyltransferase
MFCAAWKAYGDVNVLNGTSVVLSVGNFDGVHVGHKHLLSSLRDLAAGMPTVVMTFDPHPRSLFLPEMKGKLLCTVEDRVREMLNFGIDVVLVQSFSKEFSQISADEFVAFLIQDLPLKRVLLGFDFRFGHDRSGDFALMHSKGLEHGFEVFQESVYMQEDCIVSSSEIRRLIALGDMQKAKRFLSRSYSVSGLVVRGDQRGRLLGYPTVNLGDYDVDMMLPLPGVYAGYVEFDEDGVRRPAVMSFGVRPTFGSNLEYRAEAHVFDFSADVYGRRVRFYVEHRLRGEEKFADVGSLKAQMALDSSRARQLLS